MRTSIRSWICLAAATTAIAYGQTGTPGIAPFDRMMSTLMPKYDIPGGSLTIVKDGHLLAARGYGLADKDKGLPVQPDSRFRIASLSKLITSVAIMHLQEQGKLSVDQPAFALLPDLPAPPGATEDPRLKLITIRHLLTHTAGWDSSAGFDPMFAFDEISQALGVPMPPSTENIIRYMRGQPLDFNPGSHYRYSNFGFAVLGRIIERVSGMSYEQYVRTQVLAPMGVDARIGNTLQNGQLPGEVKYYAHATTAPNVFSGAEPQTAPWQYGGWCLECMDSHGGWVISTVDYAKFLDAIDGRRGPAFLSLPTVLGMTQKPNIPDWGTNDTFWYAFGVGITLKPNGYQWGHSGGLDGTATLFVRTPDGLTIVVFFNFRPPEGGRASQLSDDLFNGIMDAIQQVSTWPAVDYYSSFPNLDPGNVASEPALNAREGVLNAASFDRGLVPGSWAYLTGVNLSNTARSWTAADFNGNQLPKVLDGVGLTVNGKAAAISYISPTTINFQVPAEIPDGWWPVVVTNNGIATSEVLAGVARNSPAAFLNVQNGVRYAIALKSDDTLIDAAHPARPGDIVVIYATGLEPSPAGVLIGAPRAVSDVSVHIGGAQASLLYSGLVAPGLFQINVVVPDAPAGDQPLFIASQFLPSPQGVVIPIAPKN